MLPEDCSVYECGNHPPPLYTMFQTFSIPCGEIEIGTFITWGSFIDEVVDGDDITVTYLDNEELGYILTITYNLVTGTTSCPGGGPFTFDLVEYTVTVTDPCDNVSEPIIVSWPYVAC